MNQICEKCNILFTKKRGTAGRFCSLKCSRQFQKETLKKKSSFICANCPNILYRSPNEVKKAKNGYLFCSRTCMAIYNNKNCLNLINSKKKRIDRICKECGGTYKRFLKVVGKRCEDCYEKYTISRRSTSYWNEFTLKEFYEKHPKLTKFQAKARISDLCRNQHGVLKNNPCENCGYKLHIEFCHIKPRSSFSEDAKIGEINSRNNIIILCPNCHWELDRGILKLSKMND